MLDGVALTIMAYAIGSSPLGAVLGLLAFCMAVYFFKLIVIRRTSAEPQLPQVLAIFEVILFLNNLKRWLSGGVLLFVRLLNILTSMASLLRRTHYSGGRFFA